jgi:lysophospholipase L1-like esterase
VELLRERFSPCVFSLDAAPLRRTADTPPLAPALVQQYAPDCILLATGSNDADIDWRRFVLSGGADIRQRSRPAEIESAVRSVHGLSVAAGAALILTDALGLCLELRGPELDRLSGRDVQAMIRRAGGQARADRFADEYRTQICAIAASIDAPVAFIGRALAGSDPRLALGPDGLHPSVVGHRAIADAIAEPIISVLGQIERGLQDREA